MPNATLTETKPPKQKEAAMATEKQGGSELKIEQAIFDVLGKPKNFHHIKISNVYDNRYRIDIWCSYELEGFDIHQLAISDSFFIHWNGGKITKCNPELKKKYDGKINAENPIDGKKSKTKLPKRDWKGH